MYDLRARCTLSALLLLTPVTTHNFPAAAGNFIMATAMKIHELSKGWQFKQTDTEIWLSVAHVPTNVHLDLMNNGM